MKIKTISWKLLLFIGLIFSSCSEDVLEMNQDRLKGTWISTNRLDTLEFVNNNSFFKNSDHFEYNLAQDSIEVRYNGILYILVQPTRHNYTLTDDILVIDFTNDCFGFESTVQTFEKQ